MSEEEIFQNWAIIFTGIVITIAVLTAILK